ncbi:hypothetical protein MaudMau93_003668 [Microsporum audouinii]
MLGYIVQIPSMHFQCLLSTRLGSIAQVINTLSNPPRGKDISRQRKQEFKHTLLPILQIYYISALSELQTTTAMATTLLEYLTQPNPRVNNSRSLEGLPTKAESNEDIVIIDWEDFTYETLMSCYGGILRAQSNGQLPEIFPPIRDIEREIYDEDSLDRLLTRSVVAPVSESLSIAWQRCYPNHQNFPIYMTRGGRARGSINDLPADELAAFPDWAGAQRGQGSSAYLNRCPGDTKLSTKWRSGTDKTTAHYYWPYAQLIRYCGENWNTRYGYLITQEELVVLRISRAAIPSGIANKRSPRNVVAQSSQATRQDSPPVVPSSSPVPQPPVTRSPPRQAHLRNTSVTSASSAMSIDRPSGRPRRTSVTASLASLSMSEASEPAASSSNQVQSSQSYKDDGTGGEYRPIEMKRIPWSNSGGGRLTIKLALWWIHMMAGAPGCDITIGPEYPALDTWVLRNGTYHHTTTGMTTNNLPESAKTISPRHASRGIVTPPRQQQPSSSSPSSQLSSAPPTREELAAINWLPQEAQWQYRTTNNSRGLMRDRTLIWSDRLNGWYYVRLVQGRAQWVSATPDEDEDDEDEDEDDESDESMGLPPAPGPNRKR